MQAGQLRTSRSSVGLALPLCCTRREAQVACWQPAIEPAQSRAPHGRHAGAADHPATLPRLGTPLTRFGLPGAVQDYMDASRPPPGFMKVCEGVVQLARSLRACYHCCRRCSRAELPRLAGTPCRGCQWTACSLGALS